MYIDKHYHIELYGSNMNEGGFNYALIRKLVTINCEFSLSRLMNGHKLWLIKYLHHH